MADLSPWLLFTIMITTTITTTTTTTEVQTHFCEEEGWKLYETRRVAVCMKVVERPRKRQEARKDCIAKGGDLVSILDSDTHDFIKENVMGQNRYWIGLYNTDGTWSWNDQTTQTSYTAWRNTPRNLRGKELCVELIGKHQGRWNDKVCNAKRGYICQKNAVGNAVVEEMEDDDPFGWY